MNTNIGNLELKMNAGQDAVTLLTGSALPLREPQKVNITGDINTVKTFVTVRRSHVSSKLDDINLEAIELPAELKEAFTVESIAAAKRLAAKQLSGTQAIINELGVVLVDKDANSIVLQLDPENYYGGTVTGTLEDSKELGVFCINEQKEYTREQMIQLIRFNRLAFKNAEKADFLLNAFKKFSATAFVELAKDDDSRGNMKASIDKTVKTGIPESFELNIPIYKGQPKESFEVNICLDVTGTRVSFWFESVELVELQEQRKDEIFADVLTACEGLPIIHK